MLLSPEFHHLTDELSQVLATAEPRSARSVAASASVAG
jgi:hypothetical protein